MNFKKLKSWMLIILISTLSLKLYSCEKPLEKIAIIGWGSLLWNPGELKIDGRWKNSGPKLPLEFARQSQDGRLTLVIYGTHLQQTYWTLSQFRDFESARKNLAEREGTSEENIHFLTPYIENENISWPVFNLIMKWFKENRDIDRVLWTGLPSNWEQKFGTAFSYDSAMNYIRAQIAAGAHKKIEEYFRKAPSQIQTHLRSEVECEFKWTRIPHAGAKTKF